LIQNRRLYIFKPVRRKRYVEREHKITLGVFGIERRSVFVV